jgi:hypothetical protein
MARIQNHKEDGIGSLYDHYDYEAEEKRVTEPVADHIVALIEGRPAAANVIPGDFRHCSGDEVIKL